MGEKKNQASAGHKALYRKYRSKSLNEIVGQEHITKTLENALKSGRLSHAYLFTGPRGTGKTSVARILAHEINKLPYEDEKPHLDIIEIDAASNRRIDDIRDLRDKVHIAPVLAKYKVYIIDEVHMLTSESFNALLKTLEEPPEHVIFILATTEVHKLPATIISRTQRHSFRLGSESNVVKHLKHIAENEGISIDDEALSLLAVHGGGSFRDSVSLLDQLSASTEPITKELVELLFGLASEEHLTVLLEAATVGNSSAIITQLELLTESGLTPGAIANQLIALIRKSLKSDTAGVDYITLMGKLLSVHNAQFPMLVLESILLSVSPKSTTSPSQQPKAEKTDAKVEPTPKPDPPEEVTQTPKKPAEPKTTSSNDIKPETAAAVTTKASKSSGKIKNRDILEVWPEILGTIKQRNNPLYTVLRLATPELDSDGLLLIFNFPFHQKKVDEIKYKKLIAETVQEITGAELAIRTIVDKSRAKPVTSLSAVAPADPAHASLISNVQDIMGGGEVVNV